MNQKIKDLVLLIRKERKFQWIIGIIAIFIVAAMVMPEKKRRAGPPRVHQQKNTAVNERQAIINDLSKNSYQDLMTTIKVSTEQNSNAIKRLSDDLKDMKGQQHEYEKTTAAILQAMIQRMNDSSTASTVVASNTAMPTTESYYPIDASVNPIGEDTVGLSNVSMNTNLGELQPFQTEGGTGLAPPAPKSPKKIAVVTAGDSVRVKLLGGVNAPTDGTPYPVVLQLVSDIHGPNGSLLGLGEARMVAAAQGSLIDSRALFRLTRLSLAHPSGRRREIEVDGWIVGEDGIRGMEGRLIDPIGKALGASATAGFLQGLGDAFSSRNITQNQNFVGGNSISVSGSEVEYALGNGMSRGADRYGRLIEDRVRRLIPHVEVLSNREATAVFARAFTIPDLMEELDQEEDY